MVEKNTVKTAGSGCAMCGKPVVEKYRPFCSKRCADLDLGKLLNESYKKNGNNTTKWTRAMKMIRDFLLKETKMRKKREAPQKKD